MKNLVVFTGAGVSAESGLKTFRDTDGLWEEYNVMDVATPEAWEADRNLVIEFYNKRRKQILEAKPNEAHHWIAELEKKFQVTVITQNIDDLHERAGSTHVLHLHGNITYARSTNTKDDQLYPIKGADLHIGDKCPNGFQLRPHVVWFGEDVPNMPIAQDLIKKAEILIVCGTSLSVYPAAGLVFHAHYKCEKYLIDPNEIRLADIENLTLIKEKASIGMKMLAEKLFRSEAVNG